MNIEEKINETSSQTFQIPDGIIAIDSSGKIIALNDSAEKLTGYNEDEFLSKKISDIVNSEEDKKIILDTIRENNFTLVCFAVFFNDPCYFSAIRRLV